MSNSVRFLYQPTIRNKYVYITDIDIFFLEKNFYLYDGKKSIKVFDLDLGFFEDKK